MNSVKMATSQIVANGATPPTSAADADAKAQEFAHRVVEFADAAACVKFFDEKRIDLDKPNATGATVLMTVVARGSVELIGLVLDRTTNVTATTIPNGTTVLHLAAMAPNPQVIQELTKTDARKTKLRAIANACNRNGDTPLMMASVVKNAVAAKILVEYLDASATPTNATGMTALMCAARLQDAREGPPKENESASIVSLLLAYGADVNAAECAGRQTALHFALLSNNIMVVEQLLTILDINLTARNKAGHSPLELARKLKLDGLIDAAVESQWQVVEEEAQLLSEQVAQELENVTTDASTGETSTRKAHKKKKKATTHKKEGTHSVLQTPTQNETTSVAKTETVKMSETEVDGPATAVVVDEDANPDDWVTATKKKTKRKGSISKDMTSKITKASTASNHKLNHKSKPKATLDGGAKLASTSVVPAKVDPSLTAAPRVQSKPTPAAVPLKRTPAPWSADTVDSNSTATASVPPPSKSATRVDPTTIPSRPHETQPLTGEESAPTYDDLNGIFHRMYPIAGEMDIPVETFLAGADAREAKQLLDNLSVSQIEMLQEAHLQAYHYLNERKIEMARTLEAERLKAQLHLRRQLFDM